MIAESSIKRVVFNANIFKKCHIIASDMLYISMVVNKSIFE